MKNLTVLEKMNLNRIVDSIERHAIPAYWQYLKVMSNIEQARECHWRVADYDDNGYKYIIVTIETKKYPTNMGITGYLQYELPMAQAIVDAHNGNLLLGVSDEQYNDSLEEIIANTNEG